jgi:hypothetical protein
MQLTAHDIYDTDENGKQTTKRLAHTFPASEQAAFTVLMADKDDPEGRSQWMWVRLANGDLILGLYPQGDTYCLVEEETSK